jgi:tetrahydrodipicolinate N-succinyltransferase
MDFANLQRQVHRNLGLGEMEEQGSPIEIGHNVWIGDAAIVLDGVTIGNGAVIGAGAVVTRDVPPFAIAVGCPTRVLRFRFEPEVIEEMQELAWWEWSEEYLRENREVLALEPASSEFAERVRSELSPRSVQVR